MYWDGDSPWLHKEKMQKLCCLPVLTLCVSFTVKLYSEVWCFPEFCELTQWIIEPEWVMETPEFVVNQKCWWPGDSQGTEVQLMSKVRAVMWKTRLLTCSVQCYNQSCIAGYPVEEWGVMWIPHYLCPFTIWWAFELLPLWTIINSEYVAVNICI